MGRIVFVDVLGAWQRRRLLELHVVSLGDASTHASFTSFLPFWLLFSSKEIIILSFLCRVLAGHRSDLCLALLLVVDIIDVIRVGTYGTRHSLRAGRAKSIAMAALGMTYMPMR